MKASRIPTATLVEIRGGECAHFFWPPPPRPSPPLSPLLAKKQNNGEGLVFLSVESKPTSTLCQESGPRARWSRAPGDHRDKKTGETDNIHGLRFWSPFYHTICAIQFVPLTPRRRGLIRVIRPLHLLHARCALAEALSNRARRSRLTPQGTETSRCAVGSDLAAFERGVLASQPLIASRAAVCF